MYIPFLHQKSSVSDKICTFWGRIGGKLWCKTSIWLHLKAAKIWIGHRKKIDFRFLIFPPNIKPTPKHNNSLRVFKSRPIIKLGTVGCCMDYVCMFVCIFIRRQICICMRAWSYGCIHAHINVYVCMCVCTHTCVHTCMCLHPLAFQAHCIVNTHLVPRTCFFETLFSSEMSQSKLLKWLLSDLFSLFVKIMTFFFSFSLSSLMIWRTIWSQQNAILNKAL